MITAPQGVLGSTTEKSNPWRTALIFTAVVVLAAIVVGIIIIATKSSPGRTYPAGSVRNLPVAEGPSLSYMKKTTLKDFNKEEALSGTQSACTDVPKDWKPGYVLTCLFTIVPGVDLELRSSLQRAQPPQTARHGTRNSINPSSGCSIFSSGQIRAPLHHASTVVSGFAMLWRRESGTAKHAGRAVRHPYNPRKG